MSSYTLTPEEIQDRLLPLLRQPAVRLVVLFGSHARGTARLSSDIDLGIIADADFVVIADEIRSLLRTDRVDTVDLRLASPLLAMAVAREGRLLHEAEPGAFAVFSSLALRRYNDTAKLRRAREEAIQAFIEERLPADTRQADIHVSR